MEKQLPQAHPDGELAILFLIGNVQLIGRVKTEDASPVPDGPQVYAITKPFQLLTFRNPQGQPVGGTLEPYGSLGLMPPFEKVRFLPMHVLHVVGGVPKQMADQYLQATTGIQLAKG